MVLFNYSTKELTAKIVYYGPGLCGKTTNLQYIHANLPGNIKGKMLSLATKTDRTLFFDFLPLDLGMIRGMKTRIQLYTVPGQVFYNETRKLVLKGADGIVFVADSQETMSGANVEAFKNLEENLRAHGLNLSEMPHVIQFNKRDLPRLSGIEEMNSAINRFNAPFYESVATNGIGVQDTLKAITKLVLLHLTKKYDPRTRRTAAAKPADPAVKTPEVKTPAVSPPAMKVPPVTETPSPLAAAPETGGDGSGVPLSALEGTMAAPEAGLPLTVARPETPEVTLPPSMTLPEPPDFGMGEASPSEEPPPEFADSDIDDLVGEVGEREFIEEPAIDEPVPSSAAPELELTEDLSEEAPSLAVEEDPRVLPEEIPVAVPTFQAEAPEPEPVPALQEAASSLGDGFEVDRGFDPEWQSDPAEPSLPGEPPAVEGDDLSTGDPLDVAPETDSGAAIGDTVRLTDVVEEDTVFTDPGLDVVRLAIGGVTEIVLPVELGTGNDRIRYKLHLNLRLDHVD